MEKRKITLVSLLKKSFKLFFIGLYITLVIALSFGSVVAGIWALSPAEAFGWEVSKASYLGYYSTCAFAPFSTLMLFGLAALGFFLLIKLWKYLRRKIGNSNLNLKIKILTHKA